MALWGTNHWHSEHDDYLSSLQPLPGSPRETTRLSASELRRSVGRRSLQGIELVSAFNARFPGRPAHSIPNTNSQPVMFNVNIFDPPPPETSAATETKVSSIESLHRYAQYTGRYPKLGLFDYSSEAEDEEAGASEGEVAGMDQESDCSEKDNVGGEEEQPLHQKILVHDGSDTRGRTETRDAELNEETLHDIYERPSNGRRGSKSSAALDIDEASTKISARIRSSAPEPKPVVPIKRPMMGGKTTFAPRKTSKKPQRKAPKRLTFDYDDYSESPSEGDGDEEDDDAYVPSFGLGPAMSRTSTNTPFSGLSTISSSSRKRKRGGARQGQSNQTAAPSSISTSTSAGTSTSNSTSYKVVTEGSGRVLYECLLCPNFRTKAVGDMTRHLESLIHQDRSYACDVAGCEGLFTRKDALVRHKKLVHDPSKTYKRKAKRKMDC